MVSKCIRPSKSGEVTWAETFPDVEIPLPDELGRAWITEGCQSLVAKYDEDMMSRRRVVVEEREGGVVW